MAATITNAPDSPFSVGSVMEAVGTVTLGTYATGGVTISAQNLGLGSFVTAPQFSAAGYVFGWDATNSKVLVYRSAGFTPAGSIAVTDGDVTVLGGAAGTAIGLTADSNAGALTKAAASTRTIPQATFGIAATTAALTGTAVAASALVEVANAVNLAAVVVSFSAIGTL